MFVLVLEVDLHIVESRSLKAKRQVVKSMLESARRRYAVAAAEVAHQDTWQRAGLGFAVVAGQAGHCAEVIDEVERHVWSYPEVQVRSTDRRWLE